MYHECLADDIVQRNKAVVAVGSDRVARVVSRSEKLNG
jgi:hypothetical protein